MTCEVLAPRSVGRGRVGQRRRYPVFVWCQRTIRTWPGMVDSPSVGDDTDGGVLRTPGNEYDVARTSVGGLHRRFVFISGARPIVCRSTMR